MTRVWLWRVCRNGMTRPVSWSTTTSTKMGSSGTMSRASKGIFTINCLTESQTMKVEWRIHWKDSRIANRIFHLWQPFDNLSYLKSQSRLSLAFIFQHICCCRGRIICEDSELQMERIKSEAGVDVAIPLSERNWYLFWTFIYFYYATCSWSSVGLEWNKCPLHCKWHWNLVTDDILSPIVKPQSLVVKGGLSVSSPVGATPCLSPVSVKEVSWLPLVQLLIVTDQLNTQEDHAVTIPDKQMHC